MKPSEYLLIKSRIEQRVLGNRIVFIAIGVTFGLVGFLFLQVVNPIFQGIACYMFLIGIISAAAALYSPGTDNIKRRKELDQMYNKGVDYEKAIAELDLLPKP